uniref:F-box domain-containing protein n=1 Tax=Parastrongyloides trichosuri TaxID=131310 RepID=A0A0N4ZGS0_PARTI
MERSKDITSLSDELLVKVFDYLDEDMLNVMKTCKLFYCVYKRNIRFLDKFNISHLNVTLMNSGYEVQLEYAPVSLQSLPKMTEKRYYSFD